MSWELITMVLNKSYILSLTYFIILHQTFSARFAVTTAGLENVRPIYFNLKFISILTTDIPGQIDR